MSRSLELLALEKQLLVTRASVQRLRIAQQLGALREEARLPRLARQVAGSPRAQGALFTLLVAVAGRRGRVGHWLRAAALAVSVARFARSMLRRARTGAAPEAETAARHAEVVPGDSRPL
ncbi:MAG TPA: hypothetical protein VFE23_17335 [Usitatibacter sp.]|jgi:hypothetical protein|nr:hypothetical protein [Usitatibacter sp.]